MGHPVVFWEVYLYYKKVTLKPTTVMVKRQRNHVCIPSYDPLEFLCPRKGMREREKRSVNFLLQISPCKCHMPREMGSVIRLLLFFSVLASVKRDE